MVEGNKDELARHAEETANRLLAVERTIAIGIPKAAEQEMERLKKYVAFLVLVVYVVDPFAI